MSAPGPTESARTEDVLHFLGDFGRAANSYGATGVRIEGALDQISNALGYIGVFRALPEQMTLAIQQYPDGPQSVLIVPSSPSGVDLDKLADIYALADQLVAGEVSVTEGRKRLAEIAAERAQWTGWVAAAAWPAVGLGVCALLSGGWWDSLLAMPLSLIAYGVVLLSGRRGGRAMDWLPVTSAFVVGVLVALLRAVIPEINVVILTLAAVAILLPGYGVSLGVGELVGGRVVSGLTNLANGLVYMVKQVVGGAAGVALVASVVDIPDGEPAAKMAGWWLLLMVPILTLGLLIAFQTATRDILPALIGVLVAFQIYSWGSGLWNVQVGAFLGTLLTVIGANLWERRTRRPSAIITLPAVVFLVSGSIGFRGLASLSSGDTHLAGVQLMQMITVAVAMTAGVIVATALISKKTGL